ncbi:MAG: fibronectin type III domain-containing protein [Chloroflexi bacterium]|nr:fibronectin type III domain-containing protein [Chloroflexota bacterium]
MKALKRFLPFVLLALIMSATAAPVRGQTATPSPPSLTVSPATVRVGEQVTVSGEDFNRSTPVLERHLALYLASDQADVAETVGSDKVPYYGLIPGDIILDNEGEFRAFRFTVPATLDHGDPAAVRAVTSGTYYIYAVYYSLTLPPRIVPIIVASARITINASRLTLAASRGTVGSALRVSGAGFLPEGSIDLELNAVPVEITGGDTRTGAAGDFESTVLVPPTTAGAHDLVAKVAGLDARAAFRIDPDVAVAPASAQPGAVAILSGSGFGGSQPVTVSLNGVTATTATTSVQGALLAFFTVPDLAARQYNLEARDAAGNVARTVFTLLAAPMPTPPPPSPTPSPTPTQPPVASLNPSSGHISGLVAVSGAFFRPNGTITVRYDEVIVAIAAADRQGSFTAGFVVPQGASGQHNITVSDGFTSRSLAFMIAAVTLPAPGPVAPADGAEVAAPAFQWQAVTAENAPVTYDLQVSADRDFAGAPLAARAGLPGTGYTLTAAEAAGLSPGATYYWRVRAVDAAGNQSAWSAARAFTISGAGAPGWLWYVLAGLGGALLLALGLWLGRLSQRVRPG